MENAMFERDLLYPTENPLEPGSIHIVVYKPDSNGRLPIVIEPKTEPLPIQYVNVILSIMQADIFDRIHMDVRLNGIFYFLVSEGKYTRVTIKHGDQIEKTVDSVDM